MMQQKTVLWKACSGEGLEYCRLRETTDLVAVRSSLLGLQDGRSFNLAYALRLNARWELQSFRLRGRLAERPVEYRLERKEGGWLYNDRPAPPFDGCTEIDVSFTPLTNTLPIRRLRLEEGQGREIRVIYFDLAESRVAAVTQRYTRLSRSQYRFEDIATNFSATITVDEDGLVSDYPQLFERLAQP